MTLDGMKFEIRHSPPEAVTFHLSNEDAEVLAHVRSALIQLSRDALYKRNEYDILDLVAGIEVVDRLLHERAPLPIPFEGYT